MIVHSTFCGPEGDRTPYLVHAMHALYQVSYGPLHTPTLLPNKLECEHIIRR